jgi:hypothetical protein
VQQPGKTKTCFLQGGLQNYFSQAVIGEILVHHQFKQLSKMTYLDCPTLQHLSTLLNDLPMPLGVQILRGKVEAFSCELSVFMCFSFDNQKASLQEMIKITKSYI